MRAPHREDRSRKRHFRHPEVAAKRPSKDVGPSEIGLPISDHNLSKSATADLDAGALRGSLRSLLRVTGNSADIFLIALYIPLARPRPGFWR